MAQLRPDMTARVVALHSRQAGGALVGGTVASRLILVAQLSETAWSLTGRPLPVYTRSTMPVVLTTFDTLAEREHAR